AQQTLQSREQQLQTAQQTLRSRDQQLQTVQQTLQAREQQAKQLQQEQASLQQSFAAAQTNLQTLNQQLHASSAEASSSKEKLAALEADIRKQVDQTAALQQRLAQLAASNQVVLSEKQRLANQLQVAEVERRHAADLAVRMQEQVKVEREEKARLAEGVKALATNSVQLAREIRENRPMAPNTVFHEFLTNRVQASLYAVRAGLFGDATKSKDTETILVSNGTNTYALCHVQDTPLALYNPGTDWEGLTGTLGHDAALVPIHALAFHREDPRVVFMPVSTAEARQLGCKVYRVATDPFKFQDAVLVGAREGYYGECRFQIDPTTPEYVKLDNSFVKGLFGKFNPSRGDLVFSKNGEFLGVMANSTYCLMLRDFRASATLQFGQDIRPQRTGIVLSTLYTRVFQFPTKLQ
ncbi:MAG TPA: hypothetical protein VNZ22_16325, partial [Bacillota bacterium]|nr:hypothetical protein [Bacillota bacterium]